MQNPTLAAFFSTRGAENLAIGQNQRVPPIAGFGIEPDRHLLHEEHGTGAHFAIRLDRETVFGKDGSIRRRAGIFKQAAVGDSGVGVIIDEAAAMRSGSVGHGRIIRPRLVGRYPLISRFGVARLQTTLNTVICRVRLGSTKFNFVCRTTRIARAAGVAGVARRQNSLKGLSPGSPVCRHPPACLALSTAAGEPEAASCCPGIPFGCRSV